MKKYRITFADGRQQHFINAEYNSREEASEALVYYIIDHNEHLDENNSFLTPFDFKLEEVEPDVNEIITDFETAQERLGLKPNTDFIIAKNPESRNAVSLSRLLDVISLVQSLNPSHIEALITLNKLFTIAQAWNKEDGFIPDFSDCLQEKWVPWFKYNKDATVFVFANTLNAATYVYAHFGSRICFKTKSRAEQFGKQFVHLYNKVFLLDK